MKLLYAASALAAGLVSVSADGDDCPTYTLTKLVGDDESIRPFKPGSTLDECVYKRYSDYVAGHELWLWDCATITHKNKNKAGKYKWSFDEDTHMIEAVGSTAKNPDAHPFCWSFHKPDSEWKQRVKIERCDPDDDAQKWDYVQGRIMNRLSPNLCVGYEVSVYEEFNNQVALTMMSCFHNHWGNYELQEDIDNPRGGFLDFFDYNKDNGLFG